MLDRSRSRDRSKAGGAFSPAGLFVSGAQGAWYDPSDFSTLFQNSAGTTPVTAVEQPVRLMLDRSRGLVLGGELVTNGDFSGGTTTGWTATTTTLSVVSGELKAVNNSAGVGQASQTITTVVGRTYKIVASMRADATNVTADSCRLYIDTTVASIYLVTGNGVQTAVSAVFVATSTSTNLSFQIASGGAAGASGDAIYIDNISVRELPGNHALAPNDASRPVLRARYNQLTQSDDLTSFIITPATGLTSTLNATTAPTGAATARRLTDTVTTEQHRLYQSVTLANATEHTYTVYLKNDTAGWAQMSFFRGSTTAFANINLTTGALGTTGSGTSYSVTSVGNGWYRLSITATTEAADCNLQLYVLEADSATANPFTTGTVKSIFVWGAQLLPAADAAATGNAYQRIAAATDYDTTNPVFRPYLAFDGTDDSFSTSAIDFSGTDEMTVFAGVTKLSDAATACVMSYNGTSNASAEMFAPRNPSTNGDFAFTHRTTSVQEAGSGIPALSPATAVLTGISDISAPFLELRRNGAVIQTNTTALAANNYTSGTIRVGHRNTNFLFNGRLYSLAVLGRTATAPELSAMETWVNGKTGAY